MLFEIATIGPGFTVDEPLDHLGEKLSLTPQFEHLRDQIEPTLTPLRNPRDSWAERERRPSSGCFLMPDATDPQQTIERASAARAAGPRPARRSRIIPTSGDSSTRSPACSRTSPPGPTTDQASHRRRQPVRAPTGRRCAKAAATIDRPQPRDASSSASALYGVTRADRGRWAAPSLTPKQSVDALSKRDRDRHPSCRDADGEPRSTSMATTTTVAGLKPGPAPGPPDRDLARRLRAADGADSTGSASRTAWLPSVPVPLARRSSRFASSAIDQSAAARGP